LGCITERTSFLVTFAEVAILPEQALPNKFVR
jgi:hypothetical protein